MKREQRDFSKEIQRLLDEGKTKVDIKNILGISRTWVYELIKRHNLKCPDYVEYTIRRKKKPVHN